MGFRHPQVADATACAGLALAICAATGTDSLSAATTSLGAHAGRLDRALWDSCRANYLAGRDLARIRLEANAEADPNHPLYGRTVVFTGTLDSMTRAQARLSAASVGANATTSVSHLTNFLVAGQADYSKFTGGQHSRETLRAEELLSEGHPIEVISEADFLHLLLSGE
jgi:DNA polymerase III subunit epsilon